MKPFPRATNEGGAASGGSQRCAAEILDVVPAVMRVIRGQMREATAAELSVPQFRTLRFLSCHPGCSLSDVAEHIGLSLPSMSKIVQQLLQRGFVNREIDRVDRRRTMLEPTPKGERVLNASRDAARDSLAESIASIGAQSQRTVLEAMRALRMVYMPEMSNRENGAPRRKRKAATEI